MALLQPSIAGHGSDFGAADHALLRGSRVNQREKNMPQALICDRFERKPAREKHATRTSLRLARA